MHRHPLDIPTDFAVYFRDGVFHRRFQRFARIGLFKRFSGSPEAMLALQAAIVHRWKQQGKKLPQWNDFESFLTWLKENWPEILEILLSFAPLFFKGVRLQN